MYGRVPHILPSLDQIDPPDTSNHEEGQFLKHGHRLREISVQAMVEQSAHVRINRAMNSKTTIAAGHLD